MLNEQQQEKITNGEYERAFTEFASVIYEQYRKQKRQLDILSNANGESSDEESE